MPAPMGGFNLSDVLQQYQQAGNFWDSLRKRKEEAEARERYATTPDPEIETAWQEYQQKMGPGFRGTDEERTAFMRRHAPPGGFRPGVEERIGNRLRTVPTLANQGRMERARQDMGRQMEAFGQFKAQNEVQKNALMDPTQPGFDATRAQAIIDANRRAELNLLSAYEKSMYTEYADLVDNSDFQEMMRRAKLEGVLGPGTQPYAPPPGAANPQLPRGMPNISLPNLTTRG